MDHAHTEQVLHRLLLIRHGETVDNVAGLYAGSRDSILTNHGVLQASRLAQHLADRDFKIDHIFTSNLSRAVRTSEAVRSSQATKHGNQTLRVLQLPELREQDFGSFEGKSWAAARQAHGGQDPADIESKSSMQIRANRFLNSELLPLLEESYDLVIAIVAHGMILSTLWKCILSRQKANTVRLELKDSTGEPPVSLFHLGGWSNTGYLELELRPMRPTSLLDASLTRSQIHATASSSKDTLGPFMDSDLSKTGAEDVTTEPSSRSKNFLVSVVRINYTGHLRGLKRTGGGVGSSAHDANQKSLESFFKRRKPS